jgi:hypothetical protein
MVTRDVTPKFQKIGTPIAVGDNVAVIRGTGHPIKGTLTELTDWYAKVDDAYFFWTDNIAIVRPKDLPRRRADSIQYFVNTNADERIAVQSVKNLLALYEGLSACPAEIESPRGPMKPSSG